MSKPMNEYEAAQYLGVSPKTMQAWRRQGRGPKFIRLEDRLVRYLQEDLDVFVGRTETKDNTNENNQ